MSLPRAPTPLRILISLARSLTPANMLRVQRKLPTSSASTAQHPHNRITSRIDRDSFDSACTLAMPIIATVATTVPKNEPEAVINERIRYTYSACNAPLKEADRRPTDLCPECLLPMLDLTASCSRTPMGCDTTGLLIEIPPVFVCSASRAGYHLHCLIL